MASPDLARVMETQPQTAPQAPAPASLPPQGQGVRPGANPVPAEGQAQDPKVSSRLTAIVTREKRALERERQAIEKENRATARLAELEQREGRVKQFETVKETAPLKALELLGLSYEDLTTIALRDGNIPPELAAKKTEEKIDSFLKSQSDKELALAEDAKARALRQEEQATQDFKVEIGQFIQANAKDYELIRFEGIDQEFLYAIIDDHYSKTQKAEMERLESEGKNPLSAVGRIMTIKEAADFVEKKLEEKYDPEKAPDKIKSRFLPKAPPKPQFQVERPQLPKPTSLNNNHSATPSAPRTSPITDEERVQRAIAFARNLRK